MIVTISTLRFLLFVFGDSIAVSSKMMQSDILDEQFQGISYCFPLRINFVWDKSISITVM
jgi:hypothetical protein